MGVGVAQSLAQAGFSVVLVDVAEQRLVQARDEVKRGVRMQGLFGGGERASTTEVLARIATTTDLSALAGADFVIENVTEKWAVKEAVYRGIDTVCPPHCIFAANTSAIPITRIASVTGRPERVLGMHFMNPVPLKPMVEVIRGFYTSEQTLEVARDLLASMAKECIVVADSPGFVSNRVLMLTINEAIALVHDGVASAEEIDRIFRTCFGHKMGPLETGDLIGLDTILLSLEVLVESYGDRFMPAPLLRQMVYAGNLGRKSGRGFYQYESGN